MLSLVASCRAALAVTVRRHGGVSGGEFVGGMRGPDVGPPIADAGVHRAGHVRSYTPFLGRVPSGEVLAMFEAGRQLAAPSTGVASQAKAKPFGHSWSCLDAGRRP